MLNQLLNVSCIRAGKNCDGGSICGFVAEGKSQAEREQQRKHKHPEHNLLFADELQHARHEQVPESRPASVPWRSRALLNFVLRWCLLRYRHGIATRLVSVSRSNSRTHLPGWLGVCSAFPIVPPADPLVPAAQGLCGAARAHSGK